jgi:hypothetical protein
VSEYALCSRQEYDHVVALQTYVLHIGCAYGPAVTCGGDEDITSMDTTILVPSCPKVNQLYIKIKFDTF